MGNETRKTFKLNNVYNAMQQKIVGILALDQHENTQKLREEIENELKDEDIIIKQMPMIVEEDYTPYNAFIILPYEEQLIESEKIKNILNEIRFEETKNKPVFAYGNAAKLLLENNFIPEAADLTIKTKEDMQLPKTIHMIHLSTRATPWTTNIKEDEVLSAKLKTQEGCIQIKETITDEKEQTKRINNLFLHDQVAFCYCTGEGNIQQNGIINPYMARENIAALHNRRGNVLVCIPLIEIEEMKKITRSLKETLKKREQPEAENINREDTEEAKDDSDT